MKLILGMLLTKIRLWLSEWIKPKARTYSDLTPIHQLPDGTWMYEYTDALRMPFQRTQAIELAVSQYERRVTDKVLIQEMQMIMDYLNEGKLVDAGSVAAYVKMRVEMITNEAMLEALAAALFVYENEDYPHFNADLSAKKVEHWRKYPESRNFFLWFALKRTGERRIESMENLAAYLEKANTARDAAIKVLQMTHLDK